LKSGYFPKSTTWAAQGFANNAHITANAPIELRYSMIILPRQADRRALGRRQH
jgi:hypothetical protein